jgi:glycosyltransferase involved in cell wall biosynthesis
MSNKRLGDKKGRILLLTRGGVNNPLASAGINHHLYRALGKHYDVFAADVQLRGWRRYVNALYALSIAPRRLRRAYYVNLWAFRQRTRRCEQILRQRRGEYDLIFQIHALHAPSQNKPPEPYVVYDDCTHRLAELEYPPWDTFRPAQRERWYHLETRLYQQAGCVFARSSRMADLLGHFYKVAPHKVATVGAGINFETWPDQVNAYDAQTILFIGKDVLRKGIPCLLEAFDLVRRRLPDARLIIVGPKKPIKRPGVQFLGRVTDREHIQRLYAKASLFAMPSLFEPWGNVFTEAMAHRLPCVGTTVGGIPDIIIDGETGYLIPPNTPEILAERLLRLLQDPELARQMGERGYRRAMQMFTWDEVVDRMRPHLDQLIREHLAQER